MELVDLVKWIVSLVLIPIGVVLAFLKIFFNKWLDNRFRSVGEANRQDHEKELVRLRLLIDSELSRSRFVGVKQFEVVSELWVSIMEAFWSAQIVLNPIQQSLDLRYVSDEDRAEYLTDIEAPGRLVRKLDEAADSKDFDTMNRILSQYLHSKKLSDALNLSIAAFRQLDKVGIVLPLELHDSYRTFLKLIQDALFEKKDADELSLVGPDHNRDRTAYRTQAMPMRDDLLVRTRAFLVEARPD
ncbi:MAG: hypothetical protein IPI29_04145 [Ignavibacteria bacterium]|nr:hypothetical protein [Ignavibacteria bacterium]